MRKRSLSLSVLTGWLLVVAALIWFSGAWFGVFAQTPPTSKFDAHLKTVMHAPGGVRAFGRSIGMRKDATARSPVKVLVLVTDEGKELEGYVQAHSGKITSKIGDILVVDLPFDELNGMGALSSVRWVEASQPLYPTNDIAREGAGANVNAAYKAAAIKDNYLTGRGVIVGIIDSGIDQTNKAFNDSTGKKTRIEYVWVQNDPEGKLPLRPPSGFSYGTEYTSTDIDALTSIPRCLDLDGHGTHVAGTAAGYDHTYPGMAPEAALMVVQNEGSEQLDMRQGAGTGSTIDAYAYLLNKRDSDLLQRPLVVNESQGTSLGPHDGSTLFERALQKMVDDRKLITCISAGNRQSENLHAQGTLGAGETLWLAAATNIQDTQVEVWLPSGIPVTLQIRRYKPAYDPSGQLIIGASDGVVDHELAFGETGEFPFRTMMPTGASVLVQSDQPYTSNGDYRLLFTFHDVSPHIYRIGIKNPSTVSGQVDCYLQRYPNGFYRAFLSPSQASEGMITAGPTRQGTLGMPGTTPGAITVGAYATRLVWRASNGNIGSDAGTVGDLGYFSSLGPVRNRSLYQGYNSFKPDIVGPGQYLVSQRSVGATYNPDDIIDSTHVVMQGTSMSSPAVAGCVALLLSENPTLTAADIKKLLFETAKKDDFTGTVPNDRWGNGKIDLNAAWDKVASRSPEITKVIVDPSNGTIDILGKYFAASSQILVNYDAVPALYLNRMSHTAIRIYYNPESLVLGKNLYSVTVKNFKAPQGKTDATYWFDNPNSNPYNPPSDNKGVGGGSKGCFIATAAYGSYLDPHVVVLRDFRDRWLLTNRPGSAFVDYYYRVSPPIASYIAAHPTLRFATRVALTPVVLGLEYPVAAVLVMFLVPMACVAWRRRRVAAAA